MIEDIIKPIKLLSGSHADTGATGHGCFMNVASYLNGDAVITDESPCVCVTIRPIAIWLNDYLKDDERNVILPFIERALGSATDDKDEMERRVTLVVQFAQNCASHAALSAKYAAKYATESAESAESAALSAAEYAKYAGEYASDYADDYAAKSAAEYAKSAAESAESAEYADYAAEYAKSAALSADGRKQLIDVALDFLDKALPPSQEPSEITIARAKELAAMTKTIVRGDDYGRLQQDVNRIAKQALATQPTTEEE